MTSPLPFDDHSYKLPIKLIPIPDYLASDHVSPTATFLLSQARSSGRSAQRMTINQIKSHAPLPSQYSPSSSFRTGPSPQVYPVEPSQTNRPSPSPSKLVCFSFPPSPMYLYPSITSFISSSIIFF